MEFNPNYAWNHEIFMEDQILYDQNVFSKSIWPGNNNFPLQTPHTAAGSSHVSLSTLLCDHIENHIEEDDDEHEEELGAMKEMMYKIASMQPVNIDPATIRKPKRRNIRISEDPQSVAARHRRERISEKIRILQRLVPGGTKMDTASMLDEAIRYVKFLKRQIRLLQSGNNSNSNPTPSTIADWQVANTNKSLGSSTSSSQEPQPRPTCHGLVRFGGNGADPLFFNHHESMAKRKGGRQERPPMSPP